MPDPYLKENNVPREFRKQVLDSFKPGTITLETAGPDTYGLRFYGGGAQPKGRYLFETFTDAINRENLALPANWNSMEGIAQFQVKEGTQFIAGTVGPQFEEGARFIGGAKQWYIPNLDNLVQIK
ncbi:hypothetical protein [Enterococcus sp. AZ192]|uniref:hypothetical protein n=1 Tax=unclassified Enterococcus TaxID=2608891 RepID=UPI003D273ED7